MDGKWLFVPGDLKKVDGSTDSVSRPVLVSQDASQPLKDGGKPLLAIPPIATAVPGKAELRESAVMKGSVVDQVRFTLDEVKQKMRNVHVSRPIGKAARGKGQGEIRTFLVQTISGAAAAATDIANVLSFNPVNANDFASYSLLYDEVRVHSITVYGTYSYTTASTVFNPRSTGAWCYDPIDATAPASVVDTLSSSQFYGPFMFTGATAAFAGTFNTPLEVSPTKHGFHVKKFVVPRGIARSNSQPLAMSDEWTSVLDPSDYFGVFKHYVENGGTTSVIGYRIYFRYDVSFRSRH